MPLGCKCRKKEKNLNDFYLCSFALAYKNALMSRAHVAKERPSVDVDNVCFAPFAFFAAKKLRSFAEKYF